jgi:tryptophan synthase beta chain
VSDRTKFILDESQIPSAWYNVIPDLPSPPPPPLHPGTLQPVGPDDLAPLFPMELIGQEVTGEHYVDIPGSVIDVYKLWRPTPLVPGRQPQAQHRRPAGVLQRGRGDQAAHHRDRRRPVGQRAGVRGGAVRPGLRDLDGPRVL